MHISLFHSNDNHRAACIFIVIMMHDNLKGKHQAVASFISSDGIKFIFIFIYTLIVFIGETKIIERSNEQR